MKRGTRTLVTLGVASAFALSLGLSTAWADPAPKPSGHGDGYGKEGHGDGYGMGGPMTGMMKMMGGMHGGTAHFLRHLVKHQKEIGLSDEQVAKLKEMELNLDRTRIKTEADIMVAEREHAALVEDEKSDLAAIEAKIKQSMDYQLTLRMAVIKTKRDALALLTPEQRIKEKAEHEKMMQQHKDSGKGHGNPHGGGMKDYPQKGGNAAPPEPPSSMKAQ
jgi:Spy/CpxP family protein refolding chaperone